MMLPCFCYYLLGWLHNAISRLYESRYQDQVHDGGSVASRMPDGRRSPAVLSHHAGRGSRENNTHRRPLWITQEGNDALVKNKFHHLKEMISS